MMGWAVRCLFVAMVAGTLFASLQDQEAGWSLAWLEDAAQKAAARTRSGDDRERRASLEIAIPAGAHGHFQLQAMVNGQPIDFVVDTGATDVMLTMAAAERLGFRSHQLDFSKRYQSANGVVRGAPVNLREFRIGQFSLYDLEASVNEAPLGISLLGMAFLNRLHGYEVRDGRLILRW